jgi:hypothetical protein
MLVSLESMRGCHVILLVITLEPNKIKPLFLKEH